MKAELKALAKLNHIATVEKAVMLLKTQGAEAAILYCESLDDKTKNIVIPMVIEVIQLSQG